MKRMNKRGDEGWTVTNLLLALFALIIVALIIYYFYTGGKGIVEKYAPSDLMQIAGSCEISAGFGSIGKVDYCTKPQAITLGSKTVYVNCAFEDVDKYITDRTLASSCSRPQDEKAMCTELSTTLGANYKAENVIVSRQTCSYWATK